MVVKKQKGGGYFDVFSACFGLRQYTTRLYPRENISFTYTQAYWFDWIAGQKCVHACDC